ncbi:hypothetical protein F4808DRAFT_399906 [Astrocystis sublimbata]|nr:hypothetical protein F4808DRAFT_399906 [Astrocystis sublimbata]
MVGRLPSCLTYLLLRSPTYSLPTRPPLVLLDAVEILSIPSHHDKCIVFSHLWVGKLTEVLFVIVANHNWVLMKSHFGQTVYTLARPDSHPQKSN